MPDLGWLRGLITLLTLGAFLGVCWWAYRPGNRERFESDAWMAFEDVEIPPAARAESRAAQEDRS